MPLKHLSIKPFYNSKNDDLINDFYLPILSNCTTYKRVSAYFDSNILSLYSKGIENIVHQSGHVYFIFSCELNARDFEIIKSGYEERLAIIDQLSFRLNENISSIELKNLGYLIKHNYVDIKIAFTKDKGIFHDKFGLMENNGDKVYFRGSNNETVASVKINFESFETTCSWNTNDNELLKLLNADKNFDDLWNNRYSKEIFVIDIPTIIKEKLISYSSDRLIFTYDKKENTFVLDYLNNQMIGINNLDYKELLSPMYSFYKRVLENYVEKIMAEKYIFKNELKYLKMKNIIEELIGFSLKQNFHVYVSQALRRYIFDNDILIEKRRSLGIAIKQKNNIVVDRFYYFNKLLSKEMIRPLREPQLWDAFHLTFMKRGANFSVPGAGKTSIVYGAFAYLSSDSIREVDKIVMVGPINSFASWKNEFVKCFGNRRDLKVFDYQKEKEQSSASRFDQIAFRTKPCNLIMFNYESLQSNIPALRQIVDSRTLLVFDEVHRIKSVKGVRANSALKICENAGYRVVLTGTPIPNGYIDLYNMLNILFTDEYSSFFGFDFSDYQTAKYELNIRNAINNAIYPFFCRTSKIDLKVPPAEPDNIIDGYCITNNEETILFEILYRAYRHNILLLYIRLIQASTNPSLVLKNINKEEMKLFDSFDISNEFTSNNIAMTNDFTEEDIEYIKTLGMTSKFYKGIELVSKIVKNGSVIIWGIFIDTISKIKIELENLGIKAKVITGGVPTSIRDKIIEEFINKEFDVLITNPHTLGESISLHMICHQAVYFEYSFNLVHMLQSRDRIHRLGLLETDKTYYYYLMLDNPDSMYTPIDKKIYLRLLEKEKIQNEALSADGIEFVEDDIEADIKNILDI